MPDVDNSVKKKNPIMKDSATSHQSPSLLGKYHVEDVSPTVVVAAVGVVEVTVFCGLCLLDPDLGYMLLCCSTAIATFLAGIYYTMQRLQARETRSSYYPSSCLFCNTICVVLVVIWLVIGSFHVAYGVDHEDAVVEIFLYALSVVSIPVLVVRTVHYFKTALAALPHQGETSSNSKDAPSQPSLLLIRCIDSLLTRILVCVGVIFSLLFVAMIVLMARDPYVSWTEVCFEVFLMGLFFGAFAYLLVMFFVSHLPRRNNKNSKKVVVETAALEDEHRHHPSSFSEPLLGRSDILSKSENDVLIVV
jgi:hypothetical protein